MLLKTILRLLICCWTLFLSTPYSWAVDASLPSRSNAQELPSLTLELLQERLKAPTQSEGIRMLDLSRLNIDLRPENALFRGQFYERLQALQRPGTPLGLDLSYSQIQGDFALNKLGLRAPLYGQGLLPLFSPEQQEQLERDRKRSQLNQFQSPSNTPNNPTPSASSQPLRVFRGSVKLVQTHFKGSVDAANTFFLNRLEAQGADFAQDTDWTQTRFTQPANFTGVLFQKSANFQNSIFFAKVGFGQGQFRGVVNFQGSDFQSQARFHQALFQKIANFSQVQWRSQVDFSQSLWREKAIFNEDKFFQSLFFADSTFEQAVLFREAQFQQPVYLRGASILSRADFSYGDFAKGAYLNITGLEFDSDRAKILGVPGHLGRYLFAPTLSGNETLFRNLVQNFRQLQQISDANQVEYTIQRLRLREVSQKLWKKNINLASIALGWQWLGISLLLLLSRYGSNFLLVFGIGLVAIAYFGLVFWLLDRWRRLLPKPIVPTWTEANWMLSSSGLLAFMGLTAIFNTADQPWWTLICLGILILPIPLLLLSLVYFRGRYHDLMHVSYFVEEGTLRQLRLLIGRLPIIPRYELFRERYMPLLWDRRWNWLNYYDFSLNNLFKFGFNDIRLRDEHLPGLITTLVWYQWILGFLYIALLLWTLSRTIPGLNLLIYLK